MESLLTLLQQQVTYLRELLSNLTLEEQMIRSSLEGERSLIRQERKKIHTKLGGVKRKQKGVVEEESLEITSLLEQIASLEEKIKEKKGSNRTLTKMQKYQIAPPGLQKQKPIVKKKPLLLEEESN